MLEWRIGAGRNFPALCRADDPVERAGDAGGATQDQRAELIENCRRIFQLSQDATIEDINRAMAEADEYQQKNGSALTALSSRFRTKSPAEEEVRQRLGISSERWNRFNAYGAR